MYPSTVFLPSHSCTSFSLGLALKKKKSPIILNLNMLLLQILSDRAKAQVVFGFLKSF